MKRKLIILAVVILGTGALHAQESIKDILTVHPVESKEKLITVASNGTITCNKKYNPKSLAEKFLEAIPYVIEKIKLEAFKEHCFDPSQRLFDDILLMGSQERILTINVPKITKDLIVVYSNGTVTSKKKYAVDELAEKFLKMLPQTVKEIRGNVFKKPCKNNIV